MKNIKIHDTPSAKSGRLKWHREDWKARLHINSHHSGVLRPLREVSTGIKEAFLRLLALGRLRPELHCGLFPLHPQGSLTLLCISCQGVHTGIVSHAERRQTKHLPLCPSNCRGAQLLRRSRGSAADSNRYESSFSAISSLSSTFPSLPQKIHNQKKSSIN